MLRPTLSALAVWLLATVASHAAQPARPDLDGFVSMFNGRDLSGWVNVNCAPETWSMANGTVVCTGKPIGALRTERQYENFIIEVEWRHLESGGNSGVFIWGSPINAPGVPFLRGIEVQALDHGYAVAYESRTGKKSESFTTHGDVFPIHGATMIPLGRTNGRRSFPSEDRSKPSPEWNHYRIVANNGSIRLHVNGKEVSGGDDCNYRKGYLALESEGAPVEFRNMRIKELPSTGAAANVTAPLDPGWRSLFNGLDLRGWQSNASTAYTWSVVGEKIQQTTPAAGASATPVPLWHATEFGDAEFIVDFQPGKAADGATPPEGAILVRGRSGQGHLVALQPSGARFTRFTITVQGRTVRVQRDGAPDQVTSLPAGVGARGQFGLQPTTGGGVFMNLHAREL